MICHVCSGTGVIDQGPVGGSCQRCDGLGCIEAAPTPAEVREVLGRVILAWDLNTHDHELRAEAGNLLARLPEVDE